MELNVKQALARLHSQLFDYVHKQSRILDNSSAWLRECVGVFLPGIPSISVSPAFLVWVCVFWPGFRLLANLRSCSFAAAYYILREQLRTRPRSLENDLTWVMRISGPSSFNQLDKKLEDWMGLKGYPFIVRHEEDNNNNNYDTYNFLNIPTNVLLFFTAHLLLYNSHSTNNWKSQSAYPAPFRKPFKNVVSGSHATSPPIHLPPTQWVKTQN